MSEVSAAGELVPDPGARDDGGERRVRVRESAYIVSADDCMEGAPPDAREGGQERAEKRRGKWLSENLKRAHGAAGPILGESMRQGWCRARGYIM